MQTAVVKTFYGKAKDGEDVYKYSLTNQNKLQLDVISLGGIVTKLMVPDRHGNLQDIVAGFDDIRGYSDEGNPPYLGALIGRVTNRIGGAAFTIDGVTYNVTANEGRNQLHGGPTGWSKKLWHVHQEEDHISLSYTSADGEEGYPGEVQATVTYQLTNDNEVILNFTARAYKKATPINLTSHGYFNLAGQGNHSVEDHEVSIFADGYVEIDSDLIPTGNILPVKDTMFDLRTPVLLSERLNNVTSGTGEKPGYDHSFVIRGPTGTKRAARVYHSSSGRVMEVYTNQPAVQFYTGNHLDLTGKGGQHYGPHTALCLETQNFPDAVNRPNFPDSVLYPGSTYRHQAIYKFSTA